MSAEEGCASISQNHNIKMPNSARRRVMQHLQVNDGSFVRIAVIKTALVSWDFYKEDC